MPANVCTTCNRRFSKTEHLRRHERSHTSERPYRCSVCHKSYARSDVLFRHFKKHEQDAKRRTEERSRQLSSMHGIIPTSTGRIELDDVAPDTSTAVDVSDSSHQSIAATMTTSRSPGSMPERTSTILEAIGHNLASFEDVQMITVHDQCGIDSVSMNFGEPQDLISALTPPLSSGIAPQQGSMFDHQLDTLNPALPNEPFNTRDILASQDGTSEGSPFELDHSWWLPLGGLGDQNPSHVGSLFPIESANHFSTNHFSHKKNKCNDTTVPSTFENRFSRLQDYWAQGTRRTAKPMSNMWHDLTTGDGLFNTFADWRSEDETNRGLNCSWTLDSDTRQRVWLAFNTILHHAESAASAPVITPEMVEIAYEQYVIHHQNAIPLIHMPSFHPQKVPASLLVVMCSIGFSVMSTRELNKLVANIFPELLKMASDDLYASGVEAVGLNSRLTAMLTAFLVVTLGSVIGHKRYVTQNEILYVNLLTSAQSDGLFSAHQYPPSLTEISSIQPEEKRWMVWGSVEFVKRFVLQLIQFDCWYASYLAVDPVLRLESVFVMSTCEDALFQAPSLKAWSRMRPDFDEMIYPVVSASYSHTPRILKAAEMMPTLLMLLQLRLVAATTMLDRSAKPDLAESKLLPWKIFDEDVRSKPLVMLTTDLARAADEKDRNFDMNNAISWHASCMALGTNMPLFETAAGRSGPAAGAQALKEISKWASTPSSRRSAIHASHIFRLLLNRRVSDPVKLQSIIGLFQAALVLGYYISAMPDSQGDDHYNLYDEVDWAALGHIGLSDSSPESVHFDLRSHPAARYIMMGGGISLSHYIMSPGHTQARKCWLHFASLMLGLGRWKSRTFSRILHVMCDSLSDLDPNNSESQ